ncbi:MAG: type II toxin-antitoxin system HicB family antitoxin [Crinalium sp.]
MKIRAIIHPAAEGGFWAEVPALPGGFLDFIFCRDTVLGR